MTEALKPTQEAPATLLDELFRENAIPMSDRNGRLYDAISAALSGVAAPAGASDAVWLIHYDDADRRPEIVVGEAGARTRFARISENWNAHLFVKVASNSSDDRYANANIALSGAPAVAVADDKLAELQRDAARYRWLTKNAYVGVCYTDQVESGEILEIGGCDRRVPDEVGEFCEVGKAIDAAMAADGIGSPSAKEDGQHG